MTGATGTADERELGRDGMTNLGIVRWLIPARPSLLGQVRQHGKASRSPSGVSTSVHKAYSKV
jgi:hypothetical protein